MSKTNEINELRYYLEIMKVTMAAPAVGIVTDMATPDGAPVFVDGIMKDAERVEHVEPFKPTYLVTATKLPNGKIELAINTDGIPEKIDYILNAYDDDMRLKSNPEVVMQQLMVV